MLEVKVWVVKGGGGGVEVMVRGDEGDDEDATAAGDDEAAWLDILLRVWVRIVVDVLYYAVLGFREDVNRIED